MNTLAMLNKSFQYHVNMPFDLIYFINVFQFVLDTVYTYIPSSSNFSSTDGALKLRRYSPYSVMSRFSRSPPLIDLAMTTCLF